MSEREALERALREVVNIAAHHEGVTPDAYELIADVADTALAAASSDTGERCEAVDDFGGIAPAARCDRPAGHAGDHEAGWRDHAWAAAPSDTPEAIGPMTANIPYGQAGAPEGLWEALTAMKRASDAHEAALATDTPTLFATICTALDFLRRGLTEEAEEALAAAIPVPAVLPKERDSQISGSLRSVSKQDSVKGEADGE